MTTINATVNRTNQRAALITWASLGNGDDGGGWAPGEQVNCSVQIVGTMGSGGSINIEGSNDGTNWEILTDWQGNALTFTAEGLSQIMETPQFIRPNVTAGDGSTDLSIYLFAVSGG